MGLLLDTLAATDILTGATEAEIVRFMLLGKSRVRRRGHTFWRAEERPVLGSVAFVVPLTGEAKLYSRNLNGREFIYAFVGPGECGGLPSAFDGVPHANTLGVTRWGEFFQITRQGLATFQGEFPEIRSRVCNVLTQAVRREQAYRADIALRSVAERSARFFVEHACMLQADGARILVSATQAELAARLGSVREVVARVLAGFIGDGLLKKVGHDLFVANWAALCGQAGLAGDFAQDLPRGIVTPRVRTCRFFLSSREAGRRGLSNDPRLCHEHVSEPARCRAAGCPAAFE